jgi:hypothetical protein
MAPHTYSNLVEKFQKEKCQLSETKESFDEKCSEISEISKLKVDFIASCGHPNTVTITNFISKKSGLLCKDCIKIKVKNTLQEYHSDKTLIASKNHIQESDVYNLLKTILIKDFEVCKTNEGCRADFIIKPLNAFDDKWLLVQLKTTTKLCHSLYTFHLNDNKYDNHIIVCYCIEDQLLWLIPHDKIKHLKSILNIGKNSVYDIYKTDFNNIDQILLNHYNTTTLFNQSTCMIPRSINQQIEVKYKTLRENNIKFLTYIYPEIEQCCYDFMVNTYKIQEKVASKRLDRSGFTVMLHRSAGKVNGKRTYCAYSPGMNDFYWIHIPDSDIFYILPEHELITQGFIRENTINKSRAHIGLSLTINHTNSWYCKYQFNYKSLDENIIKEFFE